VHDDRRSGRRTRRRLNSIISDRVKRTMQSIVYLPHFLSWVIVIALWQQVFGGAGFINQLLRNQGYETINIMGNPGFFKGLVVLQSIWKEMGWGTIIFLAALTRIEVELCEAAVVDGAGGWRRLWHVTLPGIRNVIVLLLILRLGAMLSVGFEQYYLQRGQWERRPPRCSTPSSSSEASRVAIGASRRLSDWFVGSSAPR
jgi:putative aldouronate transport system permease protein